MVAKYRKFLHSKHMKYVLESALQASCNGTSFMVQASNIWDFFSAPEDQSQRILPQLSGGRGGSGGGGGRGGGGGGTGAAAAAAPSQSKQPLRRAALLKPLEQLLQRTAGAHPRPYHRDMVESMYLSMLFGDGEYLATHIQQQLMQQYFGLTPSRYIGLLRQALHTAHSTYKLVKGVRIRMSGPIGKTGMAKVFRLEAGVVPYNSFGIHMHYVQKHIFTNYGVIGLKLWIHYY